MKYRITIPQPCHEDWNLMTPTERGKFCAVCQKEVLDFTHLTDRELVQRLDLGKKMCGRFRENQLNIDFHSMENASFPFKKWWLGAASVLSLGIAGQAQVEQDSVQIEQTEVRVNSIQEKDSVFIIKGKVIDDFGPIYNAEIKHFSRSRDKAFKRTYSDENGYFEIEVYSDQRITVTTPDTEFERAFRFTEFKTNEINIIDFSDYAISTENIIVGGAFIECKPNLWQRFTNIFRSKENRKCATRNH